MSRDALTFGWFLPSWGDTDAFGDPKARIPSSPELFDRVVAAVDEAPYHYLLMPVAPTCWEASVLASYYVARTQRVAPLLAIRSGYSNPTLSAKMFATLDRMSRGRLAINLIAGISDRETLADGIPDSKAVRYEKMDEEVQIMKLLWTRDEPIAFEGRHYRINQTIEPKPQQKPFPPFFLGGGSPQAAEISARHSSVHLFWGEKPSVVRDNVAVMRQLAAKHGRREALQFGMRLQVICRDSEEEAWAFAKKLIAGAPRLAAIEDMKGGRETVESVRATSDANRRVWQLLEESGDEMRIHPHLWTGIATVRVGAGIAVVGNPRQVADTLEEFIEAGCTSFCLSGYPHADEARIFADKVIGPYFATRLSKTLPRGC
jgi:alkanesulfonate monooxygenase